MRFLRYGCLVLCVWVCARTTRAEEGDPPQPKWNPELAAKYLDARAQEWIDWPKSARSQETSCISCHTTMPYLLTRGALGRRLDETAPPKPAQKLLADIRRRVEAWSEVTPWYDFSPEKSTESLGTESVINAFLLATNDVTTPPGWLRPNTKTALENLWGQQRMEGPAKGSWPWLDFDLEPWESEHAEYWGATLAAIATGVAPQSPQMRERFAPQVEALRTYLRAGLDNPALSLHNRAMLLLASHRLEGLLEPAEQARIADALVAVQRPDGSWSLADLGEWKEEADVGDAYATGLCAYVLHEFVEAHYRGPARNAAHWLSSHQNPETGAWPAASLNKKRDATTNAGKFTQDAATAFAVLALTSIER